MPPPQRPRSAPGSAGGSAAGSAPGRRTDIAASHPGPGASPFPSDLHNMPKIELHVHLEGSIDARTLAELVRRHGEDPEEVLPLPGGRYPRRFTAFQHFVRLYLAICRQIRTPEDLALVASRFARGQAEQGIRYTEVTFTALTHVRNGMEPAAMWQALREGFADAPEGTDVRLIVDAVRDLGPGHAEDTVALVERADAPIVGLGLAGSEFTDTEPGFRILREAADRLGIGLAVHAGETGPADNIRVALDLLGADRIGHGIAAVDDPNLLDRLVAERIPLEVCPTSNVALGVVASLEEHPVAQLWRSGAEVTVNSDDSALFSTSLTDELRHTARVVGLDRSDLAETQRRAAGAAFADEQTRGRLLAVIADWEREG